MADPKYVVRAVKFHCGDESGFDWAGSDEPVWIFTANDEATPNVKTRRSKEFADVDSGDTRNFDMANGNIVWPQSGTASGARGPIGLSIQVWEIDQGNGDAIAKKTQQAFDVAGWVPVVGTWISKLPSAVPGLVGSLVGDDLLGSRSILYTKTRLAQRLPTVGGKFTDKFHFSGGSGDVPWELAGSADYDVYIQVTRVS